MRPQTPHLKPKRGLYIRRHLFNPDRLLAWLDHRVRAADAANNLSASSNVRLATAIAVTDPVLESGVTIVKAAHVTELRQAVNALRAFANLPPTSWTDTNLQGVTIQAIHVTQVRDSLNLALQAIGLPTVTYTDTQLSGVTVKRLHIEELRTGITRSGPGDGAGGGSPVPRDGLASVSYDQTTNRINTAGWEYDATGNLTRAMRADGTLQKYVYDAAGRLVKVQNDATGITQVIHTYGASNHRLIEQVGNESSNQRTYSVWSGDSVIAEYEETPAAPTTPKWTKSFVYLGSRLLATLEPNGPTTEKVQYHHPDRLGTRLVTNASDSTVFEQVTLPYGTALDAESTGATKRRFTSYERSQVSGLDYAVNRFYDPAQGRFTQADPIGMAASSLVDPQSLNMYAYCGNDPTNNIDPAGLFFGKLFRWIGKLFKAIAIAVAVALIVVATINIGNPMVGWAVIAKAYFKAGVLLGSALGPSWLRKALSVASRVVGGFEISVGRTPSTFPGGGGSSYLPQDPSGRPGPTPRQIGQQLLFDAVYQASLKLRKPACAELLSTDIGNPNITRFVSPRKIRRFYQRMSRSGHLRYTTDQKDLSTTDRIAETAGLFRTATSVFGPRFLSETKNERIVTALHELGHATAAQAANHYAAPIQNATPAQIQMQTEESHAYNEKIRKACLN